MAAALPSSEPTLDIREQLVRIDRMQAELNKNQVELTKISLGIRKVGQDTRLAPATLVVTALGAGAALFAAGAAFAKLLMG